MTTVAEAGRLAELDAVIDRFRADPDMRKFDTAEDVGGCWMTAHRFAWYCHEAAVPYTFRRWRNLPGLRTDWQHNVEVDGLIVCWTHRQIDAEASWSHVEPFEEYARRFGEPQAVCTVCGLTSHDAAACPGITEDPMQHPSTRKALRQKQRELDAHARQGVAGSAATEAPAGAGRPEGRPQRSLSVRQRSEGQEGRLRARRSLRNNRRRIDSYALSSPPVAKCQLRLLVRGYGPSRFQGPPRRSTPRQWIYTRGESQGRVAPGPS